MPIKKPAGKYFDSVQLLHEQSLQHMAAFWQCSITMTAHPKSSQY